MVSVVGNAAIFCHVPKNGGSSVSHALGGVNQYWPMHVPWRCLSDDELPGFGFIRNPWHRMVSLYYFLLRSPARHRQRVNPAELRKVGFKRWLMEGETFMSNEPVDGEIWIRQNRRYMPVGPGNTYHNIERLEHPEWGLPPMQRRPSMWWLDGIDAIGKVETLQNDLNGFAKRFGFTKAHVNRTNVTAAKPQDWRSVHDSETIDFVAKHHAPDIEFGGYTFEG